MTNRLKPSDFVNRDASLIAVKNCQCCYFRYLKTNLLFFRPCTVPKTPCENDESNAYLHALKLQILTYFNVGFSGLHSPTKEHQ